MQISVLRSSADLRCPCAFRTPLAAREGTENGCRSCFVDRAARAAGACRREGSPEDVSLLRLRSAAGLAGSLRVGAAPPGSRIIAGVVPVARDSRDRGGP